MQNDVTRDAVRVLAFAASLRADSLNKRLLRAVADVTRGCGAHVDAHAFADFICPSYDGDVEDTRGLPAGAVELSERLAASDALIIASPEYNGSMPGTLKNVIDWVSRRRPQPFEGKPTLLVSASPSLIGGNRGLWALRVPLEMLNAHVYPEMFSLAEAHRVLTSSGEILTASVRARLQATVCGFLDHVAKVTGKRASQEVSHDPAEARA